MVQPSDKWLEKFNNTLVPEMFVRITYSITEPGLQNDATPSTNGETLFSNVSSVTDISELSYTKYATGEPNFAVLDGTFKLFDKSGIQEAGYVSELCVSDSNHPVLTLSFSKIHTADIPGITIKWSSTFEEWATSFKLTAYSESKAVSSITITDNHSVVTDVDWDISGYDSMSIQVLTWCIENRRARIEQVQLGRFLIFEKQNIISYEHNSTRDPISGQLPKDSITFTIDNSNQTWNPLNPEGMYRYLYERQQLTVDYGMEIDNKVEWITGGRFFLSEWSVPSNSIEASFTARDAFAYLMTSPYTGRMYGTLYEIAYDALELLSEDVATAQISDELKSYSTDITSDNKSNYKNSDILQLVANATGMALYQTRDGVIVLDRVPDFFVSKTRYDGEISELNNYSYPEISFSSPLKNVSCSVNVKSGSSTVSKTYSYPEKTNGSGVTQTVNNVMLSENILTQSKNILTEAYRILSNRKKASLECRISPHFDALDFILIHHQFGYSSVLLTTGIKYKYSGCFKGTIEGYMLEGSDSN
mgnify:CR=1 FL=1